jgi:hypothetical protein
MFEMFHLNGSKLAALLCGKVYVRAEHSHNNINTLSRSSMSGLKW